MFFGKPKGWIKHKTPDAIEMLFCGMACFEAFTYTKPARKLAKREEEYRETKQEALVRAPA